jgi:hypothetical protein
MKPSTLPILCGTALACMSAAVFSHWWSVNQFIAAVDSGLPLTPAAPIRPLDAPEPPAPPPAAVLLPPHPESSPAQKEFYEELLTEMRKLRTENRDLLDQMAETNRDLMKLEFRVDTHSESFRPLPVSEERIETTYDDGAGVLPPRAEPVYLPMDE